jgi:outer membrane protein assembly factor BamB
LSVRSRQAIALILFAAAFEMSRAFSSGTGTLQDPQAGKNGKRGEDYPTLTLAPPPPETRIRLLEAWRVPLGSPLSGPLLSLGDRLVSAVENGVVQAVSPSEGRPLWKTDLGEKLIGGPVEVLGRVVQASVAGKVRALEAEGGEVRWTVDLERQIWGQPTSTRDGVLVPIASGQVVSLDAEGRERWRVDLKGAPSAPVAACRGMVLAGTEAGTLEAFDRVSGRRLWISETGSPVRSPLLCYRGTIYFGAGDNRLRAIKYNGRRRWSYQVGGAITAVPFPQGDRICFLCYDNYIYVLKARSGHLLLRVRMSHRLSDDAFLGPKRIYLSPYTSARIVALTLPDLQRVGEYRLDLEGEWFTTPPVRAADLLLIGYGRYEGRILALREEKEPAPEAAPSP